jgi:diguanylate cyclase (GGDEF)-like protein/PAS domain S-box-containing protein
VTALKRSTSTSEASSDRWTAGLNPDDLVAQLELYENIVEHIADAVVINLGDKRVFVNQAYLRLHGLTDKAEALGRPVDHFVVPDDRKLVASRTVARQEGRSVPPTYEYRIRRTDGEIRTVETSVVTITYRGQPAALAVLRDVTRRHELEERLASLASHDPLTNMLNRRAFYDEVERMVAQRRLPEKIALMFLDVDGLKQINDRFGHRAGDSYLIEIAEVLRRNIRRADIAGRLGGDEFALLLPNTSVKEANVVARRILKTIRSASLHLEEHQVLTTASIGMALVPEHATAAEELLHCADLAMYIAKLHGGDRAQLYDPSVDEAA